MTSAFSRQSDSAMGRIHQSGTADERSCRPMPPERLLAAPGRALRRRTTTAHGQRRHRTIPPCYQRRLMGRDDACCGASLTMRRRCQTSAMRPDARIAACSDRGTMGCIRTGPEAAGFRAALADTHRIWGANTLAAYGPGRRPAAGDRTQPLPRCRRDARTRHAVEGRLGGSSRTPATVACRRPGHAERPPSAAYAGPDLGAARDAGCAKASAGADTHGRVAALGAAPGSAWAIEWARIIVAWRQPSRAFALGRSAQGGAAWRPSPACLLIAELGFNHAGRASRTPVRGAAVQARNDSAPALWRDASRPTCHACAASGTSGRARRCLHRGRINDLLADRADRRSPPRGPPPAVSSSRAAHRASVIRDQELSSRTARRARSAAVGPTPHGSAARSVISAVPPAARREPCLPTCAQGGADVLACQPTGHHDSATRRRAAGLGGLARRVRRSTWRSCNPASGAAQGRLVGWRTGRAVGSSGRMGRRC